MSPTCESLVWGFVSSVKPPEIAGDLEYLQPSNDKQEGDVSSRLTIVFERGLDNNLFTNSEELCLKTCT